MNQNVQLQLRLATAQGLDPDRRFATVTLYGVPSGYGLSVLSGSLLPEIREFASASAVVEFLEAEGLHELVERLSPAFDAKVNYWSGEVPCRECSTEMLAYEPTLDQSEPVRFQGAECGNKFALLMYGTGRDGSPVWLAEWANSSRDEVMSWLDRNVKNPEQVMARQP